MSKASRRIALLPSPDRSGHRDQHLLSQILGVGMLQAPRQRRTHDGRAIDAHELLPGIAICRITNLHQQAIASVWEVVQKGSPTKINTVGDAFCQKNRCTGVNLSVLRSP